MANNRLVRDVPAGTIITAEMVEPPRDSLLWSLRRELDEVFGLC
jgi:predicted homoserine dehydrogenase-like protein